MSQQRSPLAGRVPQSKRHTGAIAFAVSALALVNGCGSEPQPVGLVYNVVYSLEVVGPENEVRSVAWVSSDGNQTVVPNPPDDWSLPRIALSGDRVGATLEGSVRNGTITLRMSATSEGNGGVSGSDSCSDTLGILQQCNLSIPLQALP